MHIPTLTAMKQENDYLREHPSEMKRELYWQGKVMLIETQIPEDALDDITSQPAEE